MKSALTTLMDEHRHIERACGVLIKMAKSARNSGVINAGDWDNIIDFIKGFADACHHMKEEGQLFKMMNELGMPTENGPIAVMLSDHEDGRKFVRGMVEAVGRAKTGDEKAVTAIIENALGYADFLPQHISKEDNILYPMADEMLSDEDNIKLLKKYEQEENHKAGHGKHEAYLRSLAELAEKYGVEELTSMAGEHCFSCHGHS